MKRDDFTMPLAFPGELIIDNFAGGGGTSTGLEAAFGRPVDIAINHDPEALAMHAINHPHTRHLCESVWDVDPVAVTHNQPVALVWLSPDCKHFSKAKGATPVKKEIRGLAWVGVRWVIRTRPRTFMLENVEEFQTWGTLLVDKLGNSYPDPTAKGQTFRLFRQMLTTGVPLDEREANASIDDARAALCTGPLALTDAEFAQALDGLRYDVECRDLRACDHDTPTIRKRFFMAGRRDGLPITWPDATHAEPSDRRVLAGKLAPFRTAAECIDFTLPAASVFDRPRPLAVNTMRRVAKGLWRHVLASPQPFIVGVGGRMGQSPERSTHAPMQTITSKADSCVAQPILAPAVLTNTSGHSGAAAQDPLPTVTTGGHHAAMSAVLTPYLTEHANASNQRTMAADEPLRTQCAQVKGGHFSVVAPSIAPLRGTTEQHLGGHDVQAPLSTISAGGQHHALTGAHLITIGYGEREGQPARAQDIERPIGTVVAANKHALVAAHLVDAGHGEASSTGAVRWSHGTRDIERPLNTVTASGATSSLAAVHLTHLTHHGERSGTPAGAPLPTVTAAHRGEQAMVAACLEQANGGFYEGDGRAADAPMSTITASGSNQRLVSAYLVKYYGTGGQDQAAGQPMHTLTTKARMGLVQVEQVDASSLSDEQLRRARLCAQLLRDHLPEHFVEPADVVLMRHQGGWWVLVDITLRMLKPRELFRAQGFPEGYVIEEIPDPARLFDAQGRQAADPLAVPRIPLSATAQVRMCGNSVCPPLAEALVRANFAHEAQIYGRAAA